MAPFRAFTWMREHVGWKRLAGILSAVAALGAAASFATVEWVIEPELSSDSATGANQVSHSPDFGLKDAQEFQDFSILWVGETFEGFSLTSLVYSEDPGIPGFESETRDHIVTLGYGDCKVPVGATACPIPLTIHVQPYCENPPEDLAELVKTGPPVDIRGSVAQWTGGDLVLWTSDVSVAISGTDPKLVNAAAHNLVSLTPGGPVTSDDPLGAPLATLSCPPHPSFNQLDD